MHYKEMLNKLKAPKIEQVMARLLIAVMLNAKNLIHFLYTF